MASPFEIIGFSSTDFDPGFISEVRFGAGALSASSALLVCLLVGNMTSAGSSTVNSSVDAVFDQTQADALYGPGSELARMCEFALKVPGVVIMAAPVTESVGAAATIVNTFATNASSSGTWIFYIGGRYVSVAVASGDTPTTQAANMVLAVNGNTALGCTAANTAGAVTLTWKQLGLRGNDIFVRIDQTQKPTATTSTLSTGTAVSGLGMKFASGTTGDDLTTVASNTFPGWYQRVGLAHRDATNLGVWETSMDAKAGWEEQHPQHTVVVFNGALASAQSLTQTTLNNQRFNFWWGLNTENDPAELAAYIAALRSVGEQSDPGRSYTDEVIPGALGQFRPADNPQRSTRVAANRTGVSVLWTQNSALTLRRAVTTKCLTGSNADYRTLDVGQAYVPDFIRFDLGLLWLTEYKANNPVVASDPAPEQPERPSGVATPKRWSQYVYNRLKEHEAGTTVSSGIGQIIDVDSNLPSALYDAVAKRIMSAVPVVPSPRQEQVGAVILQR